MMAPAVDADALAAEVAAPVTFALTMYVDGRAHIRTALDPSCVTIALMVGQPVGVTVEHVPGCRCGSW